MRTKIVDDGENVGYTFPYKQQRLTINMPEKVRPISEKTIFYANCGACLDELPALSKALRSIFTLSVVVLSVSSLSFFFFLRQ